MASMSTDRALRAAVARLATLSDEDVRGVLAHLSPDEADAVTALLAEAATPIAVDTGPDCSGQPLWALERVGAGLPGASSALAGRGWPSLLAARPARITPHAAEVLRGLVLEAAGAEAPRDAAAPRRWWPWAGARR